jgi:hypothetical protein
MIQTNVSLNETLTDLELLKQQQHQEEEIKQSHQQIFQLLQLKHADDSFMSHDMDKPGSNILIQNNVNLMQPIVQKIKSTKGVRRLHFPIIIYNIIQDESPDIIKWQNNGTSFRICDYYRFENEIVPKYFKRMLFSFIYLLYIYFIILF